MAVHCCFEIKFPLKGNRFIAHSRKRNVCICKNIRNNTTATLAKVGNVKNKKGCLAALYMKKNKIFLLSNNSFIKMNILASQFILKECAIL